MMDPVRKCIACGQKKGKQDLIRIVKQNNGRLVIDLKNRENGRGAYVCRNAACVTRAREKNRLSAVFHIPVQDAVYLDLARIISKNDGENMAKLLGLAVKSGKAVLGFTGVSCAIKRDRVFLVILDGNHQGETTARLLQLIKQHPGLKQMLYRKEPDFDQVVGKVNCRCAGITDAEFAHQLFEMQKEK